MTALLLRFEHVNVTKNKVLWSQKKLTSSQPMPVICNMIKFNLTDCA
jgi:hypothetical protein